MAWRIIPSRRVEIVTGNEGRVYEKLQRTGAKNHISRLPGCRPDLLGAGMGSTPRPQQQGREGHGAALGGAYAYQDQANFKMEIRSSKDFQWLS